MTDYLLFVLLPVIIALYAFGLGWLVLRFLGLRERPLLTYQDFTRQTATVLAAGILLNYIIVLVVKHIQTSLILGSVLAIAGVLLALTVDRRLLFANIHLRRSDWARTGFALLMALLLFVPILSLPLYDWDARSIWFFHGKMIYYAGTLGPEAGWNIQTAQFSHVDYPKLVPVMAAQLTIAAGYWNESLPKASLALLLIPALLLLSAEIKRDLPSLFLILMLVFVNDDELWNGYMDGYLALFTGLALLAFARFMATKEHPDLLMFLAFAGILPALKNEGIVAALILVGLAVVIFLFGRLRTVLTRRQWLAAGVLLLLVVVLPTLLWQIDRTQMGLKNDLALGSQSSMARLTERLSDGTGWFIFKSVLEQIDVSLFVLTLLLVYGIYSRKALEVPATYAILSGIAYLAGMILVYFMTPHDVGWHIGSSVNRTMLTVNTCFFIAGYLMMIGYSSSGDTREARHSASTNRSQ